MKTELLNDDAIPGVKPKTKKHSRVLAALHDQPWAITESWHETLCSIVEDRSRSSIEEFQAAAKTSDDEEKSKLEIVGDAAVIPVSGPIFPKSNLMTAMSGATSSQEVSEMLDEASNLAEARSIGAIVMHFDSPGGAVVGGVEVADKIFSIRQDGKIPIIAMVEGVGASLAYTWASQCDAIYVTSASMVGSVSIVSRLASNDRALRNAGVDSITVNSGMLKNAGDPSTLAFAAQYQSVLDRVNTFHEMIANVVRRGRGSKMDMGKVETGDVWIGQKAVAAGLADGVTTLDALLSDINS